MNIELSPKQIEFINNANHRFNFKIGATQCGKTYIDVQYIIPNRILNRSGKVGINLILGVTRETIERNVLEPMRDIWGPSMVSQINSKNWAYLFGNKVYCLGSEKVSQVSKLRGAKFKYVYIDELVDMNEEVFELLKSRMSLEYSVCDATGNPSHPNHFIKRFIDSNADVYSQSWTLYDNPFLPKSYIRNLEIEYAGAVYFDRYILGKWARAEGVIFRQFADNPERWIIKEDELDELKKEIKFITFGIDFGESVSHTVFVATGIMRNRGGIIALDEFKLPSKGVSPDRIEAEFIRFVKQAQERFHGIRLTYAFCDHPETIVNGIDKALRREGLNVSAVMARKEEINTRIFAQEKMLNTHKMRISERCENIIFSLKNQTWDDKHPDTRLDNNPDIADWGDGFEYSWAEFINEIGI